MNTYQLEQYIGTVKNLYFKLQSIVVERRGMLELTGFEKSNSSPHFSLTMIPRNNSKPRLGPIKATKRIGHTSSTTKHPSMYNAFRPVSSIQPQNQRETAIRSNPEHEQVAISGFDCNVHLSFLTFGAISD